MTTAATHLLEILDEAEIRRIGPHQSHHTVSSPHISIRIFAIPRNLRFLALCGFQSCFNTRIARGWLGP